MERRKFIINCCYTAVGLPLLGSILQSCGAIYYASVVNETNRLVVKKSAFLKIKKEKVTNREFVMVKTETMDFPICLYKIDNNNYAASLLRCTHRNCELNVGGGIYSCPCHGSEFSITGEVLEGPAESDLTTFKTETDDENIFILQA